MIWFMYGIILCICVGTMIWANEHRKRIDRQDRSEVRAMLKYIEDNYGE